MVSLCSAAVGAYGRYWGHPPLLKGEKRLRYSSILNTTASGLYHSAEAFESWSLKAWRFGGVQWGALGVLRGVFGIFRGPWGRLLFTKLWSQDKQLNEQVSVTHLPNRAPSLRDGLLLDNAHALSVACLDCMAKQVISIATRQQADTGCHEYAIAREGLTSWLSWPLWLVVLLGLVGRSAGCCLRSCGVKTNN